MTWSWVAMTPAGEQIADLTDAQEKKVTWRLSDAGEASLKITDQELAAQIVELRTDLMVLFDEAPMWRGRFGPSRDELTAETHVTTFSAVDYRGVLDRRLTHNASSFPSSDAGQVAWDLIEYTQRNALLPPGGELRIGKGTIDPIATRDHSVPAGKFIGQAIDDLSGAWPGFDWWIDADLQLQIRTFRGAQRDDFRLVWEDTLSAITRDVDPASYANTVHQTGAEGLVAAIRWAPDLGTDARPEGRWESQFGNPDLTTQTVLDDTAVRALERAAALTPAWGVTLTSGLWSPDDMWVGDIAHLIVESGRLDVDTLDRVTELTVSDTDSGTPAVAMTIGGTFRSDLVALLRTVPVRLTQLARR